MDRDEKPKILNSNPTQIVEAALRQPGPSEEDGAPSSSQFTFACRLFLNSEERRKRGKRKNRIKDVDGIGFLQRYGSPENEDGRFTLQRDGEEFQYIDGGEACDERSQSEAHGREIRSQKKALQSPL